MNIFVVIVNILTILISIILAGVCIYNIVRAARHNGPGVSRVYGIYIFLSVFGLIFTYAIRYLVVSVML